MRENDDIHIELNTLKSENPLLNEFKEKNGVINFYDLNQLKKSILDNKCQLLHGHGLWQFPVHQMAKVARKSKIPYIISPRGMLDKWPIKHKWLKKRIARYVFQDRDLKLAAAIHATSGKEAANIRDLGFKNPIAVIPNGVQLNDLDENKPTEIKKLLFLSRLVENKGIEELLDTWIKLDSKYKKNWNLEIVGEGKKDYVEKLKQKLDTNNLSNIRFLGPVYDLDKKNKLISEANLFVLPSYTENFGMVIAEALACGTPVITTRGAPWQDLETYDCGWWIDLGEESLRNSIEEALDLKVSELEQMGLNGRKLIEQKYSIDIVAKQMLELYSWILGKSNKPDFVFLD